MNIGVLFDMDGTLIDSHEIHIQCWLEYANKMGLELKRENVYRVFGMVNREIIDIFWPETVSNDQITTISDGKESMVRELYRKNFPPMPGAKQLVESLHKANYKLAVASSGPKPNVELACELLEIVPFLEAIVTGCDVERGKPDPEIFLTAAKRIGLPPNRCVVVEDAIVGIAAAHAGGMKCIGILSTGHDISDLKEADHIVYSLDEITPTLLNELIEK
ncbi:MAG: HAD family hydrolase [Thermoguttaceae bacterium]